MYKQDDCSVANLNVNIVVWLHNMVASFSLFFRTFQKNFYTGSAMKKTSDKASN